MYACMYACIIDKRSLDFTLFARLASLGQLPKLSAPSVVVNREPAAHDGPISVYCNGVRFLLISAANSILFPGGGRRLRDPRWARAALQGAETATRQGWLVAVSGTRCVPALRTLFEHAEGIH